MNSNAANRTSAPSTAASDEEWLALFRSHACLEEPKLAAAFERFFARLVVTTMPLDTEEWLLLSPCIESTLATNPYGYVRFHIPALGVWYAHHYAHLILYGEIPSKWEVHHICLNRKCQVHLQTRPKSGHATFHNQRRKLVTSDLDRRLRKNRFTEQKIEEREGRPYVTKVYPFTEPSREQALTNRTDDRSILARGVHSEGTTERKMRPRRLSE